MLLSADLEVSYVRYVRARGRAAEAAELAAAIVLAGRSGTVAPAVELVGGSFPVLERLCRDLAGTPCYEAARALGASLGRLRWLPPLAPILGAQPFEAADAAIHGAVDAMMCRAEPRDADRIHATLVPAARALHTTDTREAWVRKARRFRHGCMGEVAAALAACKDTDPARELVAEMAAEAPALDELDRACAYAAIAPATVLLGDFAGGLDLVQRAYDLVEDAFGENVDGYGDTFFDTVAYASAHVRHLATWEHGQLWRPEAPVANVFHSPYRGFAPGRADREALEHRIEHLAAYANLTTRFANGRLAAALEVIDTAREQHPDHVAHLLGLLLTSVHTVDKDALARVAAGLDALPGEDVATAAAGLARLRHTELALRHARRIPSDHGRAHVLAEIACALGGRDATRAQATSVAEEVVALEPASADAAAVARRLLADLARPPPDLTEVIYTDGEDRGTYEVTSDRVIMLVYLLGNGLEGDVRFTASTPDAVLSARGLLMGTGSCRRVPDLPDHPLYRPGDECYRQGSHAYAFLCPTPVTPA